MLIMINCQTYLEKTLCKALNTFMKILQRRKIIPRYYFCESFPSHTLNEKGIDDIIQTEEMERIYQKLMPTR